MCTLQFLLRPWSRTAGLPPSTRWSLISPPAFAAAAEMLNTRVVEDLATFTTDNADTTSGARAVQLYFQTIAATHGARDNQASGEARRAEAVGVNQNSTAIESNCDIEMPALESGSSDSEGGANYMGDSDSD